MFKKKPYQINFESKTKVLNMNAKSKKMEFVS